MKKKIFLVVVILFTSLSFSQKDTLNLKLVEYSEFKRINRNYQLYKHNRFTTLNDSSIDVDLNKSKGSPYETNDFIPAVIIDEAYSIYAAIFIRFNVYADALEIKKTFADKQYTTLIKIADIKAIINNKEYRYLNFKNHKGKYKSGYIQTLFNENGMKLLLRKDKKFHKETMPENPMINKIAARFVEYKHYYLESNNSITFIPTSKKGVLKALSAKENEVKKFIKNQKIQLKDEKQFMKLLKYYTSLF